MNEKIAPPSPADDDRETVLRMTTETKVFLWVTLGLAGVGLGLILPWLLSWATKLPIPFLDVLTFLGSIEAPIMVVGRPAVLALIGLVIAFFLTHESAILRISDRQIVVIQGDDQRIIARSQVAGVHQRAGKVKIEAAEGRVLFEDDVEGGRATIAAAFRDHGYPWEGTPEGEAAR
ncbi:MULTISPECIES: YqeB family protein [Bacteria]|uniref:YqeB family protein n=1 Tax=Bacteria TaxID=2 RepID=UPI003C7BBCE7